jgi:hypothetical protein
MKESISNENLGGRNFNHVVENRGHKRSDHWADPVHSDERHASRSRFSAKRGVRDKKREEAGRVHSSSRNGSGSDDGGEESDSDGNSVSCEWRVVVVAARSEDAEGEEEKREHFRDQSDSSVSGRVDVWEDSIGVECVELSGGFPKGNAEHGAAGSPDDLRHGVVDPFNDEITIGIALFTAIVGTAAVSGGGVNPSSFFSLLVANTSLGAESASTGMSFIAVYWVGPMVGAFMAAIFHYMIEVSTSKVFVGYTFLHNSDNFKPKKKEEAGI